MKYSRIKFFNNGFVSKTDCGTAKIEVYKNTVQDGFCFRFTHLHSDIIPQKQWSYYSRHFIKFNRSITYVIFNLSSSATETLLCGLFGSRENFKGLYERNN